MAENTSLATQSELAEANFYLQELANNLGAHSNGSLSVSHGIDTFPGRNPDEFGNDLTYFQDSGGHNIGDIHVRFTIDGISYWVPGQSSTLPGKDAALNVVTLNTLATSFTGVGMSSWMTLFATNIVPSILQINEDYLLPHTQLGHWETHKNITVESNTTYNSGGFIVGTNVVKLAIDGLIYALPATTRFGGPSQPPRLTGQPPSAISINIGEGQGNSVNVPITFTVPNGTKPLTYQWQFFQSSLWNDIPVGSGPSQPLVLADWDNGINYNWQSAATLTFIITSVNPGSDKTRSVQLRCVVTNSGGSATTNVITLTARDETGSWIMLEVMKTRTFTHTEIFRIHKLRSWGLRHHCEETKFYTGPYGKELVKRMREACFDFTTIYPTVDTILGPDDYVVRFEAFRALILDAVKKYWPDCQHPVISKTAFPTG